MQTSSKRINSDQSKNKQKSETSEEQNLPQLWQIIRKEVESEVKNEPMLASFFYASILKHSTPCHALSYILANYLDCQTFPAMAMRELIQETYDNEPNIIHNAKRDIIAFYDRDPACDRYSTPMLYYKGFHALQTHRIAHRLWLDGRRSLAFFLQHQCSIVFGVDIHPGARIGSGILIDHAHGLVIGETCVIEDDVSLLHGVTLGGTGKEVGDRHPKVRKGVLISAGAKILGNVEIGEGAKVAASSVVLTPVPPHTTYAGVPAKQVGVPNDPKPSMMMNHCLGKDNDKT